APATPRGRRVRGIGRGRGDGAALPKLFDERSSMRELEQAAIGVAAAADPDVVLRVDGDAGVLGWPVDAGVLAPPVGDERAGRAELEHVRRWGAAVARRRIGAGARFAARTERVGEVHDIDVVARVDGDAD